MTLDWKELGIALRQAADDAHDSKTPPVTLSYQFLLDNPECFGREQWPAGMPQEPNIELIAAYHSVAAAGCANCGSLNLTTHNDSSPEVGYSDPERPWCNNCQGWAD